MRLFVNTQGILLDPSKVYNLMLEILRTSRVIPFQICIEILQTILLKRFQTFIHDFLNQFHVWFLDVGWNFRKEYYATLRYFMNY